MLFHNTTLTTIAENLALDEALLSNADAHESAEVLRVWQAARPFVVLGRGSKIAEEVELSATADAEIPIYRRISGGATIVAAPGCLFYSVLLSLDKRPHLRMVDEAHRFVMTRLLDAVQPLRPTARLDGTCDLVLGNRKASGNSLRIARDWLLYHGTLLNVMDLSLVDRVLRHPPREPEYRQGRKHADFICNLNVDSLSLIESLKTTWKVTGEFQAETLQPEIQNLVAQKYENAAWIRQR